MNRDDFEPSPLADVEAIADGDRWTPVFVRDLNHPRERVWAALTEPAELGELPAEGIDALLAVAGAQSGSSLRLAAELRQLGGALDRPHPEGGAMPRLHGQFTVFCGAPVTDADAGAQGRGPRELSQPGRGAGRDDHARRQGLDVGPGTALPGLRPRHAWC
jgi:hypothetical protein